jgi:ADP-heptose:LPS heptosyltransferase
MASRATSRQRVIALAAAGMSRDALLRRHRAPPASPRRILVAHHLLLGDTIMLTPLVAKCRARWPDAEIVMTCPVAYAGLYATRPYGVRAAPYDPRDASTLKPLLAAKGYDLALVPADNRLSWLARALDARWIVAFAGDSPPYKDWPGDELRPYPEVPTAWGDLVAGLVDGPPPASFRAADWPAPPAPAVALPAQPFAVLHAGASTPLKQWPAERWRALGQRLAAEGLQVVLSAGPGETALLDAIDPAAQWPRHPGTLTLPQLWHLLARAALLVCPDTGIAHLARLVGVPTVALFGPGSALLSGAGEFWRDSPFTALTIPDFPCRDQRITMKRHVDWIRRCERFPGDGPGQCAEARCMLALTDAMVWQACAARLGAITASGR